MSMMAIKDIYLMSVILFSQARAASVNSGYVSVSDLIENMFCAQIGTWTDGTHTWKLQEADDSSGTNVADVAAANVVGAFTAVTSNANPNTVQQVSYIGVKPFVRMVLTVSGATTGLTTGCSSVTKKRKQP